MSTLQDRVVRKLAEVIDPCSVTAGAPLSVVDMGLISDLSVGPDGVVRLSMRATSAMCTMIAGMMKVAEDRLGDVEGVTRVEVKLCSGAIWTESDMTERGRQVLLERRSRSRKEVVVQPHEWKSRPRRSSMTSNPSDRPT